MTKLLEEAVKVLRELADDRQEAAARAIINYGADDDEVQLSDEQVVVLRHKLRRKRSFGLAAQHGQRKSFATCSMMSRLRRVGIEFGT
jgi:hypothetical protein